MEEPKILLTKKERRELRRQEKLAKKARAALKKRLIWIFCLGSGVLALAALFWFITLQPGISESDIVSRSGLHWHAELSIYIKGEKQIIPANIGIGFLHQPVHTHDDSGTIHMEFEGLVRKSDIRLGQFFKNWGKDIRSFGNNLKMIVNGKENTEYENYIMQDGDKIELYYE